MGEMHILKLREGEEYIKLGQALKATGLADSGIDAKEIIQQGLVLVNGEIDERRGRKLYDGDEVVFDVLEQLLIADHLGPDIRRTLRPCHTQVIHL